MCKYIYMYITLRRTMNAVHEAGGVTCATWREKEEKESRGTVQCTNQQSWLVQRLGRCLGAVRKRGSSDGERSENETADGATRRS